MSETAEIGHNGQLKSIVERIENIEGEIKEHQQDRSDIYAEAKGNGFDPKALREIVRRRKADAEKLAAHESLVEVYMASLGMLR